MESEKLQCAPWDNIPIWSYILTNFAEMRL